MHSLIFLLYEPVEGVTDRLLMLPFRTNMHVGYSVSCSWCLLDQPSLTYRYFNAKCRNILMSHKIISNVYLRLPSVSCRQSMGHWGPDVYCFRHEINQFVYLFLCSFFYCLHSSLYICKTYIAVFSILSFHLCQPLLSVFIYQRTVIAVVTESTNCYSRTQPCSLTSSCRYQKLNLSLKYQSP